MAGLSIVAPVPNDGRPDFAANPFNGPVPAYDQVLAKACDLNPHPGCRRRELVSVPAQKIAPKAQYLVVMSSPDHKADCHATG